MKKTPEIGIFFDNLKKIFQKQTIIKIILCNVLGGGESFWFFWFSF